MLAQRMIGRCLLPDVQGLMPGPPSRFVGVTLIYNHLGICHKRLFASDLLALHEGTIGSPLPFHEADLVRIKKTHFNRTLVIELSE